MARFGIIILLTLLSRLTEGAGGLNDESQLDKALAADQAPQALTTDEATTLPSSGSPQPPHNAQFESPISMDNRQGRPVRPAPPPPLYQSEYLSKQQPQGRNRIKSATGGVSVTLDGGGSWSELARQDATLPTDANTVTETKIESSSSMFGFLKSKKGRNNSPRPKERGVLGKEGARVVIS